MRAPPPRPIFPPLILTFPKSFGSVHQALIKLNAIARSDILFQPVPGLVRHQSLGISHLLDYTTADVRYCTIPYKYHTVWERLEHPREEVVHLVDNKSDFGDVINIVRHA